MIKTCVALCHGCDKEFGVEFLHEKVSCNTDIDLNGSNPIPGGWYPRLSDWRDEYRR